MNIDLLYKCQVNEWMQSHWINVKLLNKYRIVE